MVTDPQITVLGGGIAGLAMSIAASRRGISVELIEQAAEPGDVGAGIQISPNGAAVLAGFGLQDQMLKRSVTGQGVQLRDYSAGHPVIRLNFSKYNNRYGFHFFHRADLVSLLAGEAHRSGVNLRYGERITGVTSDKNGVVLTSHRGDFRPRLVVAADGIHSIMRPHIDPAARAPEFARQVAWRAIIPNTLGNEGIAELHMGPGRHLVHYPLRDGHYRNVVAVEERAIWMADGWDHPEDPNMLRQAFRDFGGSVPNLLKNIHHVNIWGLHKYPVPDRWHRDNAVLIGDAAHPTLPFLAQGANMGLEDAWTLAALLAEHEIPVAFQKFTEERQARCRAIVDAASKNGGYYHIKDPVLRFFAHSGLKTMGRMAPDMAMKRFGWVYSHDVTRRYPML